MKIKPNYKIPNTMYNNTLYNVNKLNILKTLKYCKYNDVKTANALNITIKQLYNLLHYYNINIDYLRILK